jgi:hypothetical protein
MYLLIVTIITLIYFHILYDLIQDQQYSALIIDWKERLRNIFGSADRNFFLRSSTD